MRQIQWAVCAALTLLAAPSLAAEDLGRWRYYKVIKLDTTARGAAVKRDVKSFPVAVMLLSAANFDFSQAKSDGSDLRFSKTAKGDAAAPRRGVLGQGGPVGGALGQAGRGQGKQPVAVLRHALGQRRGGRCQPMRKAVFETKEGFVGVYHLNEEGNVAEGGYKDATAQRGPHDRGQPQSWLPRRRARSHRDVRRAAAQRRSVRRGEDGHGGGQWFQVVAVHDFPKARIYVNGLLEKESTFDVNWISGDHPVGIGNQSQFPEKGRQWDGILDEARALNVAKDEHWIKLDYESQREGTKLLSFGKTVERTSS